MHISWPPSVCFSLVLCLSVARPVIHPDLTTYVALAFVKNLGSAKAADIDGGRLGTYAGRKKKRSRNAVRRASFDQISL